MKVIILCGGQGTRLREETEFRPKPLVPIGDRPILWHIMKLFSHAGLRDFVLCLGYRGNMIKEYFLNYEAMNNDFSICLGECNAISYHGRHAEQGFKVCLADTGLDTMTGGRLKRAARYIDTDTFMLTYGDGLADVDIPALLAFHQAHGKIATVTTVRPPSRFGILDLEADGRVAKFAEKPQSNSWASGGFFVFNRRVFDYLADETDDCIFERRPLERLAADVESRKGAVRGRLAAARFPSPLIKPDVPFSSIRLSDRLHHQFTEDFASTMRRSTPSFPNTTWSENLAVPSECTLWRRLRNTLTR